MVQTDTKKRIKKKMSKGINIIYMGCIRVESEYYIQYLTKIQNKEWTFK